MRIIFGNIRCLFNRLSTRSSLWVSEGEVIAIASQVVTDEPLKLRNAIRIPARSFAITHTYCSQMYSEKATMIPCDELKHKFPNIYMEPMQLNNSEGKSRDTIPYMIINLDYKDQVYIGKDTPIAYVKDEDKLCEYLEVNEIITPEKGINWCPSCICKIVTSDLVYSPAQVTEHQCVELKDQNVSEDTKQKFGVQILRLVEIFP